MENNKFGGQKIYISWKKYYSNAKKSELICPSKNEIIYICTNHKINTANKKLKFKNYICPGKLKYNRTANKFYMIHKQNSICDNKYPKIYDNTVNVTSNTYRFLNYKNGFFKFESFDNI